MKHLAQTILAVSLLAPPAALAGGLESRSGSGWRRAVSSFAGPDPGARGRRASRQLEVFTERRRFESRVRMANTARDAERRTTEARLRSRGSLGDLARYRRRLEREDDLDDLRLRSELSQLSLARTAGAERWWASLGPATRRAFLRNGLELRRVSRAQDRNVRLDGLERDIEARPDDPAGVLFGPLERP
jgi:hypothetical protein